MNAPRSLKMVFCLLRRKRYTRIELFQSKMKFGGGSLGMVSPTVILFIIFMVKKQKCHPKMLFPINIITVQISPNPQVPWTIHMVEEMAYESSYFSWASLKHACAGVCGHCLFAKFFERKQSSLVDQNNIKFPYGTV